MAEAKVFPMSPDLSLLDVAYALEDYLRDQKRLEAEGVSESETVYFIQARQPEGWKKFVGMDQAIQIKLAVYDNKLTVGLGAGRWVDKLGAAAVGYFLFAPLMLTTAIGALSQSRLPNDIFEFVERYVLLGKTMDINDFAEKGPVKKVQTVCRACGAALPESAKFCPDCGKPARQRACPVCGAVAENAAARFCAECGTPLNS